MMNCSLGLVILVLSVEFCVSALVPATPIKYVSHKSCNDVKPGTIVEHPENCRQYIICNGLRSQLNECPGGTFFNAELFSCDKSDEACKVKPTTTVTATTATIISENSETLDENSISSGALGRPLCTPWFDQQFPHPYNCEYYYFCVRGYLTVRRCQFGFGWDLDQRICIPLGEANCFKDFLLQTQQQ